MVEWAGWIIALAGLGHTLGSLVEAAPDHAGTWFGGVWTLGDYPGMSDATVAWWYSVFSFGPPLLLIGLTVLWLDRRGVTPPPFLSWALAGWVAVGFVVTDPRPCWSSWSRPACRRPEYGAPGAARRRRRRPGDQVRRGQEVRSRPSGVRRRSAATRTPRATASRTQATTL
ncbi:DUF6463 family protein [Streptomyces sp. NPDC051310]|uniref:DUF6463 family protein n=1 Tax=Streptomyces sp. NPDC051310 TaxID=3365649 RepID=UPI0037A8430E